MINELIALSSCVMSKVHVSIITNLQLRINRYKRENDKQKCLLIMIPFLFVLESVYFICCCESVCFMFCECVYFICCCTIANTVISLVAHKLLQIQINNQEKFTTRSSKLKVKVHRANSQTISSYSVRFANDIILSR